MILFTVGLTAEGLEKFRQSFADPKALQSQIKVALARQFSPYGIEVVVTPVDNS